MDIPEKDIQTYIRLRKLLERTPSYRIYQETNKQILELLSSYGKEAEKEFFKEYTHRK